jgi:hypothetical protein
VSARLKGLWRESHRFCTDMPAPIQSLDEARVVLDQHAGHDCAHFQAAMQRATGVLS